MSEQVQKEYEQQGYSLVEGAASPEVAAALLAMIRRDMTANAGVMKRFLSTPRVNAKPAYEFYGYRYPPVIGFHWGLTSRMVEVTGKRLAPTYAFFRVYQKGDICTVHSDRQSCEHSFSMALGYADGVVWPFEIGETRYEEQEAAGIMAAKDFEGAPYRALSLNPGDAILYHGVNYRHGRITPNPNRWSAHLFLHWVDLDGPYKDWAFDRQKLPQGGDFLFPQSQPS